MKVIKYRVELQMIYSLDKRSRIDVLAELDSLKEYWKNGKNYII